MNEHESMKRAAILAARRSSPDHAQYQAGWRQGWQAAVEWCADASYSAGRADAEAELQAEAAAIYDAGHAQARADNDELYGFGYRDGLRDSAEVVAKLKQQLAERDE